MFWYFRDSSKSHLLGEDDESWGDWGQESDLSSSKKSSKTSDWSAGNEDDLEAWLNDDKSALSSGAKVKGKKKSDDDWDSWKANDSSKSSLSGKSTSSSSKSKKKSQKSSTGVSSSDGWEDADWNTGFTSATSKQKQPLVGNLLDLDDGNGISSTGGGDGWDNEVWADENDADDWQTLDLAGESNKTR